MSQVIDIVMMFLNAAAAGFRGYPVSGIFSSPEGESDNSAEWFQSQGLITGRARGYTTGRLVAYQSGSVAFLT